MCAGHCWVHDWVNGVYVLRCINCNEQKEG